MSKVSLRAYVRDIEGMIEGGHVDEAIAHCLHILKTFPMHLETYRLLGKAFLENRQYANAADIFRRILMSVPDDFVSHVGMSIIADDENKLDDAIWHMERAFEVQPSNPAIQGELRRLYGRREGVEPPKIRLTRDALANMYAQGELYNQAIAEIRAVLAEDPARPDLQVMLARAYFRAGQKIEAGEMCSALLKKYAYCFDALRILTEILPGTGRAENTQVYRHRINSLDPYASFATGSVFQSDKVPDAAVNLERLEYEPGAEVAASQPDWASSLGIKLEEAPGAKPAPDWLRSPVESAPGDMSGEESKPAAGGQDAIPDWMRSAGWTESTGEAVEIPAELGEGESVGEPIAQAEIPDWLKSMAPPEALQDSTPSAGESLLFGDLTPSAGDEELPDWLRPSGTIPEEEKPSLPVESGQFPAEEPVASQANVPDWLQSLAPGPVEEAPVSEQSGQPMAEEPASVGGDLPNWLQDMAPKEAPVSLGAGTVEAAGAEGVKEEMASESTEKPAQPSSPEEIAKLFEGGLPSLDDQDAALAWLESLAAKQGAKEEELLTKPEDRLESAPDWVQKLSADETTKPEDKLEPPLPEPVAEEFAHESVNPQAAPELVTPAGEAAPDWLSSLGEPDEPQGEDEFPPFGMEATGVGEEEAPLTVGETHPEIEGLLPVAESQEDLSVTAWLQNLQAEEDVKATPPAEEAPAAEPVAEMPEWLRDIGKPEEKTEEEHLAPQPPEWLNMPVEETETKRAQEAELPEWLTETGRVEEKIVEPTAPQDWMPAEEKPAPEETFVPAQLEEQVAATPTPTVPKPTGVLSRIPLQEKESDLLLQAQDSLQQGLLKESMDVYVRLVKKGRLLDEVIHDLHEAVYRFPVDMIIWQTLGDAYMRANRLQEALDAYTKAEELLR